VQAIRSINVYEIRLKMHALLNERWLASAIFLGCSLLLVLGDLSVHRYTPNGGSIAGGVKYASVGHHTAQLADINTVSPAHSCLLPQN
jgi:hypothetical protein